MSSMRLAHGKDSVTIGSLLTSLVDMRSTFNILPCGKEHLECFFLSLFLTCLPFPSSSVLPPVLSC